jgi:beta-mannosidase
MARIRDIDRHRYAALGGWETCSTDAGAIVGPGQLEGSSSKWIAARVPGTAAGALRASGEWVLGAHRSFDAQDWWYRCRFDTAPTRRGHATFLTFGGLATIADAWLNGVHVLRSDNMFLSHTIDISDLQRGSNELAIRFSSLGALLETRRPRPRWRAALVEQQKLRWFRTTLLGRMPSWSPPVEAVGPWRDVVLQECEGLSVVQASVQARVNGADGEVDVLIRVRALDGRVPDAPNVHVGDARATLSCTEIDTGVFSLQGRLRLADAALWWPHTHGAQPLYRVTVAVRVAGADFVVDCGRVGFRTIEADMRDGGFDVRVNGVPVFCRGACWTPLDVVNLAVPAAAYADAIDVASDAGMNMIRVVGTMQYEDDAFYEACDQRGILVWQDFMFANLDYPILDDTFRLSAAEEATQFVSRVQTCPSLAILCGNSEVSQQAAMLGLPRELWSNAFFDHDLPAIAGELRPDVLYWPTTPGGGHFPFSLRTGVSHYYGVGAYRRPLDDARRSGVRFTAECLAFSHVPESSTIDLVLADGQSPFHHPAWKARVPRDVGAGWDFEDVRDHYLELLFGVDAATVRSEDMPRYLALSRVVTGEVMASVLGEWRSGGSSCRGALVWFLRDLWPGAGWGLVDSTGVPKAAFYFVRRVLRPVALLTTDEGLEGLALHAINDTEAPIEADMELALYRRDGLLAASGRKSVMLGARSTVTVSSGTLLEQFLDVTYAYRFGPADRDLAVGTLRSHGEVVGQSFYFPLGYAFARQHDLGMQANARSAGNGAYLLKISTKRFAQAIAVEARGYVARDNYFHLEPGAEREILLCPLALGQAFTGTVRPLNAFAPTEIRTTPNGSLA